MGTQSLSNVLLRQRAILTVARIGIAQLDITNCGLFPQPCLSLEEGTWTEPMDKHPPEGPLPSLPTHVACSLRRLRAERGIGAATKRRGGIE